MKTIQYKGYFVNVHLIDEHTAECRVTRDEEMLDLVDIFSIITGDINSEDFENRVKMYIDEVI